MDSKRAVLVSKSYIHKNRESNGGYRISSYKSIVYIYFLEIRYSRPGVPAPSYYIAGITDSLAPLASSGKTTSIF